ncbi:helix-turn-helix transcriptional regulator [Streptomyces sp. NPDC058157]|uniref:helix-turn-helix transcriptional regulator n=1 Tax=Streptomyces sp. NPDC058157 TaxID=3346360 RepID=UPI0036E7D4A6
MRWHPVPERPGRPVPERRGCSTPDADQFAAFLASVYGTRLAVHAPAAATRPYRCSFVSTPAAVAGELELPGTLGFAAGPPALLVVSTLLAGHVTVAEGREEHRFGPGHTFLNGRPGRPRTARTQDAALMSLSLPWTAVQAAAGRDAGDARRAVRFTGLAPVDALRAGMWRRTAEFVRRSLFAAVPDTAPLVLAASGRLLAATALAVFPNDAATAPGDGPEGPDSTSDTLRRAVVFIENNADRDIGLADIAGSVPVTPRALQYAFARHAGTTPLTYLRRVRLAQVHAELRAADPAGPVTVTEVAARWGFAHAGRFAAVYRDAYGAPPSHTLRFPAGE